MTLATISPGFEPLAFWIRSDQQGADYLAGHDLRNMPSLDKMEEMLNRYGAKVVS